MAIAPRVSYDVLGCGATTVSGMGDPNQDPCEMVKKLLATNVRFTFYVMADCQPKKVSKNSSAIKFKNYVEEHKLGPLVETQGRHYSKVNGEGYIKVYIWRPDYAAKEFKDWCEANKVKVVGRNVY